MQSGQALRSRRACRGAEGRLNALRRWWRDDELAARSAEVAVAVAPAYAAREIFRRLWPELRGLT